MDSNRPGFIRTIVADSTSYQASLLTAFLWIILIVDRIFPTYSVHFTYIVLVVSVVLAAMLVIRYRKILSLFEICIEAPGVIEEVSVVRAHVSIVYEFTYRGERFAIERSFLRNKIIASLEPGTQVTVLVDPDNLQQSIIREIYAD